ncbi:putative mitochondrial hypothetical protein [Leptomonas pyrrhocoris]|uniref:Uncharacterized protein n=1 Tax=Leptomonas pyrrhocoris TaxID=157538 RepID=A0A0M9FXS8_LEPPY|nr:putative mitochondrial hypothetical protein [Leptomonas pyrrhocoris]KPA78066.1 putative mitochondrial hypothetical protein [Leptomonas pyrrhocoris]|eukprot:XP_015656505.1 putative mitochondrial hypothetical protein [Leptomonas pyrrhocoris]
MLRHTARALSKRTPGYVFWRQSSLTELQHSKRNYLLSERPVPLAHIARRMARVKARYEDTRDFHERNLLRGEYKYFTGKLCDLRAAPSGDMIAVLQCAALFGFWDAAQVDRILAELFLLLESLDAMELVALFTCMPLLRRQESELYRRVAAGLALVVMDLTTHECLQVCRACTAETPVELVEKVLEELSDHLDELTPAQCVEVLDTWSVAPQQVRLRTRDRLSALRQRALDRVEELSCMDVAVLYTTLHAMEGEGELAESLQRRLVQAFTRDLTQTCPRSTALLFTAVRRSHALSLEVTQWMAGRVLFLATDFTPAELLAVFQLYVEHLVALCALAADLRAEMAAAAQLETPNSARPSLADGGRAAMAASHIAPSAASFRTHSAPATRTTRQHILEREAAAQNLATLKHVCEGLTAQLATTLESASAYVSVASQMEIVELYASAVEQLELGATCSVSAGGAGKYGAPSSSSSEAVGQLLRLLPQSRRVLQLVSSKLIANMKSASLALLIQLLEQANSLGSAALQDAVVAAAVQELITRDITGLTTEAARALERKLRSLTHLRAEHQRRLSTAFIPKVRRYI